MKVESLISPSKEVQERILEEALKAIKHVKDRKSKASLMYYLINDLHLFGDGNGRTARLVYKMLSEKDFDLIRDSDIFSHNDYGRANIHHIDFENQNGIADIDSVNYYAALFLKYNISQKGIFTSSLTNRRLIREIIKKQEIITYAGVEVGAYDGTYIDPEIRSQLSDEQVSLINISLLDNNESCSVSGLTMLIMAARKGMLKELVEANEKEISQSENEDRGHRFIIRIGEKTREAKMTFSKWDKDDYLEAIEVASTVKEMMFKTLIDFYRNSEKYKVNPGDKTILEIISGSGGQNNTRDEEITH